MQYICAVHSKECLPEFGRLRDLLHSYVRWVEKSIRHHSKKQHSPQVQWSNPWQKEDNLFLLFMTKAMFFQCRCMIWMNQCVIHCVITMCYYQMFLQGNCNHFVLYLPAQISKADVKFMLLTGLLLFTGVIIWKLKSLIRTAMTLETLEMFLIQVKLKSQMLRGCNRRALENCSFMQQANWAVGEQ